MDLMTKWLDKSTIVAGIAIDHRSINDRSDRVIDRWLIDNAFDRSMIDIDQVGVDKMLVISIIRGLYVLLRGTVAYNNICKRSCLIRVQ